MPRLLWGRVGGARGQVDGGVDSLNLLIAILLLFGVAGAGVGWTVSTPTLYQREYDPLDPPVLHRRHVAPIIRRRKVRRLLFTLMSFFLGVLAGLAFLFYLARR